MKKSACFILSVVVVSLLSLSNAYGKILRIDANPDCPDQGYTMYLVDDNTGTQYVMVRGCGGSTCLNVFTGPVVPMSYAALPIGIPSDHWDRVASSSQITAPGAVVDIIYINAVGERLTFRNCNDAAEAAYYQALFDSEMQSGSPVAPAGPAIGSGDRQPGSIRLMPDHSNQLELVEAYLASGDRAMAADPERANNPLSLLLREYFDRVNFSAGEVTAEQWSEVGKVMRHTRESGSNLVINQLPLASNGGVAIVSPIVPALQGEAVVYNQRGESVWSGSVIGPTTIALPATSGIYFIRSLGQAVPIPVAR